MFNQKGFSKIALIIIVLILIGGAYFVFSKKDKNIMLEQASLENSSIKSDWKIYADQNLGFKIEYPANWEVVKELDYNNGRFEQEFILAEKGPEMKILMTPGLLISVERETVEKIYEQLLLDFKGKIISNKLISFSGVSNVREVILNNDSKILILSNQGKTILINIWHHSPEIDNIIATFKFTK